MISWDGTEPELAVAWLFAVEPTDRAVARRSPQMYVRQAYGSFLAYYTGESPPVPGLDWQPGTAGGAANEPLPD